MLYIVNFSTPKRYAITLSELTYFAYLACLLSVYSGEPSGRWGYTFAATTSMSPFSEPLSSAVDTLSGASRIDAQMRGLSIADAGREELRRFTSQHLFKDRVRYLKAACNSSLAVPLPIVGAALSNEPELHAALSISATRELLDDEAGPRALHRHFERLAEEIPDRTDLFLAAVTWISQLSTASDEDETDGPAGDGLVDGPDVLGGEPGAS